MLPPKDREITTKSLADAFDKAIARHTQLPFEERIANSKIMADRVAKYVGRDKTTGRPKPLLTQNAKLVKASKGYAAGSTYDAQEPIKLPSGAGVETTGLSLSPATERGKFKLCPNSAICKDACLGKTSGNYGAKYKVNWPRINAENRTKAFLDDPEAFATRLHDEITQAKHEAMMNGNKLAVRLNVLSDVDPRVHKSLFTAHPDTDFYDYTKMNRDPIAKNHHYTYSSTGLSQPAGHNGVKEGVHNPFQNWKQMRQRLDTGSNVAMVFNTREHLPKELHDSETGKTYSVIDGTTHDYRPLDKQPPGAPGVVIGLSNLSTAGSRETAHKDSHGFFVHYDPQLKMEINKKGEETKTPLKGPSTGVNKAGHSLPRPTYAQNHRVTVAPQGISAPKQNNDSKYEPWSG